MERAAAKRALGLAAQRVAQLCAPTASDRHARAAGRAQSSTLRGQERAARVAGVMCDSALLCRAPAATPNAPSLHASRTRLHAISAQRCLRLLPPALAAAALAAAAAMGRGGHSDDEGTPYDQRVEELDFLRSACACAQRGQAEKLAALLARRGPASLHWDGVGGLSGYTPLHYAAREGRLECARILLAAGALALRVLRRKSAVCCADAARVLLARRR